MSYNYRFHIVTHHKSAKWITKWTIQNGTKVGTPGDEYDKSPWREGSPRLLKTKLEQSRTPSPQGDLLYSSPGAPGVHFVIPTASGRHFSRLIYKFYGACWLRVASWRYLSGFIIWRNSCSTSLACLFSDWIRFS